MGVGVGGRNIEPIEQPASSKASMADKIHLPKDFRVDIGNSFHPFKQFPRSLLANFPTDEQPVFYLYRTQRPTLFQLETQTENNSR